MDLEKALEDSGPVPRLNQPAVAIVSKRQNYHFDNSSQSISCERALGRPVYKRYGYATPPKVKDTPFVVCAGQNLIPCCYFALDVFILVTSLATSSLVLMYLTIFVVGLSRGMTQPYSGCFIRQKAFVLSDSPQRLKHVSLS